MAKKVTFDGNDVIIEESMKVRGLFGDQEFVNRRRLTKEEYNAEARKELQNQLGGLCIAGILAGGALLLQKALDKKGKQEAGNGLFKLPWK